MSGFYTYEKICGNCLKENEFTDLPIELSHSRFLDNRMAEYRSAIYYNGLEKCSNCGYRSSDISKISDRGKKVIQSKEYLNLFENPNYPKPVKDFLCEAMVLEADGLISKAAFSVLHAAWMCDDSEHNDLAKQTRVKAIELFHIANSIGLKIYDKQIEYDCLLVDLYRRSENFKVAKLIAEKRLQFESDDEGKKILFYQIYLCDTQDSIAHLIEEAIQYFDKIKEQNEIERRERIKALNSNRSKNMERYNNDYSRKERNRDYFDAMTDGQLGDYDDFRQSGGNIDDIDDLVGN